MRGARLDIKNKNMQTPSDCMATKDAECRTVVKLTTMLQAMMSKNAPTILNNDVSRAKESSPIQCVNEIDAAAEPTDYVYVSKNCVTDSVPIDRNISRLQHCQCTDTCSSEDQCNCSDLSVKSWYDQQGRLKDGFDYKEPPMIFECNEMCRCNVSLCHNRVIQHGISARLQVFRTYGMGWGVRALAEIPKGSFVCEYVGELISDSEADTREDSYLFDLDNRDGDTFCIDANRFGNIARFINHCCTPNVVPVKVFAQHQDLRFPHIALFACRDIKKGEELGFDYGEKFWVIKHKYFTCHCASDKCRYNKSSIYGFLKEYYERVGEPIPKDILPPSKAAKAEAQQQSEDKKGKGKGKATAKEDKEKTPEKEAASAEKVKKEEKLVEPKKEPVEAASEAHAAAAEEKKPPAADGSKDKSKVVNGDADKEKEKDKSKASVEPLTISTELAEKAKSVAAASPSASSTASGASSAAGSERRASRPRRAAAKKQEEAK